MRALWVAAALLLLALSVPGATSQAPWIYQGGEPGVVRIDVAGTDIGTAGTAGSAIRVDPSEPVDLSITISPPENTTWQVRAVTVGLLVNGPGSTAPDALSKRNEAFADLPPGFTVVINRTIDLAALKRAGAGNFLMHAEVIDANGAAIYAQSFYVRVAPGPAALLTVQGATITAVSVATGYGFWQIAKDTKEMRDAWERHRKKKARAKLDVIGAAEHAVEEVGVKVGHGVDKAVALHRAVADSEKQLGLVRWSATGLGLGGVAMAWLQFLGYLAFDASGFLIAALEGAAIFLTLALLANALLRRARAKGKAEAEANAEAEATTTRTLVPADAQTGAPQVDLRHDAPAFEPTDAPPEAPVQPVDKRG